MSGAAGSDPSPAGRAIATVSLAMSRVGGLVLLACAVLVSVEILARTLLGVSMNVSTELASYGLAVAASWAFAATLLHRGHIRVDVLYRRVPPFGRALLDLVAAAALALFGALLAWRALGVLLESARLGARENTPLATPLVVPQAFWVAGIAWFALVALVVALRAAAALARRDAATVARIAGPAGVEEELDEALAEAEARLAAARESR